MPGLLLELKPLLLAEHVWQDFVHLRGHDIIHPQAGTVLLPWAEAVHFDTTLLSLPLGSLDLVCPLAGTTLLTGADLVPLDTGLVFHHLVHFLELVKALL